MAFSKMDGLDVTPVTPASTRACRSPWSSSARRMLSYQSDLPSAASCS